MTPVGFKLPSWFEGFLCGYLELFPNIAGQDSPNLICCCIKDMFALHLGKQFGLLIWFELSSHRVVGLSTCYPQAKDSQELRNRVAVRDPRQPNLKPYLKSADYFLDITPAI